VDVGTCSGPGVPTTMPPSSTTTTTTPETPNGTP
jgi:hypothetical protein